MKTQATPKITEVLLNARSCGYRCHDFAKIKIDYKMETVECLIFNGTFFEVPRFSTFEVENLEDFAQEFFNHKDNQGSKNPFSLNQIRESVISHFKEIVAKYLMTGDTLKAGAGMLGAHQMVYVEGSEAWREHLRLENWQAERSARLKAERELKAAKNV